MKQVLTTIVSNTEIMPGAYLLCVESSDIASIAKPGQFIMVKCGLDLTLRRPISIHHIDNSNRLSILFNVVGKGTSWLSCCQKGDRLDILGPLGNGFSIDPASKQLLLVAGGIGIAPLAFLAHQALAQKKLVTLLLGAPASAQLYPRKLLPDKIQVATATEDGSSGKKGMISDIMPDFISSADQIYSCGPLPMYKVISDLIKQRQLRKNVQVSLEVRMGCGIGTCYGCSIKTRQGMKQVCQDGPVFNLEDILWQEVKI